MLTHPILDEETLTWAARDHYGELNWIFVEKLKRLAYLECQTPDPENQAHQLYASTTPDQVSNPALDH